MGEIRVLLVDDSDDFLAGISAWLEEQKGIVIAGTAATGREAIEQVEALSPDLVLMDVSMPDLNGFEATHWIKGRRNAPRVVLVTLHDSETAREIGREAGADGFVAKSRVADRLLGVVADLFPRCVL